jgi:hypothetical protein
VGKQGIEHGLIGRVLDLALAGKMEKQQATRNKRKWPHGAITPCRRKYFGFACKSGGVNSSGQGSDCNTETKPAHLSHSQNLLNFSATEVAATIAFSKLIEFFGD